MYKLTKSGSIFSRRLAELEESGVTPADLLLVRDTLVTFQPKIVILLQLKNTEGKIKHML